MRELGEVSLNILNEFLFYSEGLRTLVISQKLLDNDFFEQWERKYADAKADLNNRELSVQNCINELE
jgi:hypothetical protein